MSTQVFASTLVLVAMLTLGCSPADTPSFERTGDKDRSSANHRPSPPGRPGVNASEGRASTTSADRRLRVTLTGGVSDRPPVRNIRDVAGNALTPKEVLASVFGRYRQASNYHDRGRLVAQYRAGDSNRVAEAPMSVTLRGDAFAVVAYEARLVLKDQQIWGWIEDPTRPRFADQVLRRRVPEGRPTDRVLTSDPLLTSAISAGVAGPPPQLEWLFAEDPMKSLLDNGRVHVGRSEWIDGVSCRTFEVNTGEELFRFWVDERAELVRRVEFPRVLLQPADEGDPAASPDSRDGISMTLHLDGATFSREQDVRDAFSGKPPSAGVAVKRLVQPPAPVAAAVGQTISAGVDENVRSGSLRWMFRSDQPGLGRWLDSLRTQATKTDALDSSDRLRIHQWPSREMSGDEPRDIDRSWVMHRSLRGLPQTRAGRLSPETLWVVDDSGRVHFEQPLRVPVDPTLLMAVTADLAADVDVAARIRAAEAADEQRYEAALREARR